MSKRTLILEDGMVFEGEAFGSSEVTMGEVVFQTGMTGYQEMLSDPSYCDQMIVLTNPLIGNYGMNRDDYETTRPLAKALIVREVCHTPSNFRSQTSLATALEEFNIPGLTGIDTRQLTRHLRSKGVMRGLLVDGTYDLTEQLERLKQMALATDQVKRASTERAYVIPGAGPRIVLVDFGAKLGIIRELVRRFFCSSFETLNRNFTTRKPFSTRYRSKSLIWRYRIFQTSWSSGTSSSSSKS